MKKRYRINKLKFTFFVGFLIFLSVAFTIRYMSISSEASTEVGFSEAYEVIYVRSGDSLWTIAEEFMGNNINIQKAINEICQINQLDNYLIYPGDELLIPIVANY